MTSNRFSSAWMKVNRARSHVDDLEAEIVAYWETWPISTRGTGITETEGGGTGARTFTVENVRPLPDSIPVLVGDAVHNLRSALDHFAYAAVAQPTRQTCFPIWSRDDPRKAAPPGKEWLDTVAKQLATASPGLIDAVRALSPWETGSDKRLWAIHELDRVDKHRLLLSVAAAHTAVVFEVAPVLNPVPGFRPPTMPVALATRKWTPLEAGTVLWHVPEESGPAPDPIRFEYDVTLGEPEDLRGQPAVAQLRMLANHAETTMQALALLA
jgi:hypothetical protein